MAQYFQYWQFSGLSGPGGASAAFARLLRSMGSSGSSAAPVSSWPRLASRLRREVRCASERVESSNSRSSVRIMGPVLSGNEQHPWGLCDVFLEMAQVAAERIEHRQICPLGGREQDGRGVLRHLHRHYPRQALRLNRPARQAPMAGDVEYPDFRAAVLVRAFSSLVHRHVQAAEAAVKGPDLLRARPPVPLLRDAHQRPWRQEHRLRTPEVDRVHLAEEREECVALGRADAL